MKAFILLFAFFSVSAGGYAQKFAYVDTHYITEQMPQYKSAQRQLDTLVKRWQEEIEAEQKKLEALKQNLADEKAWLTEAQIKAQKADIEAAQKEIEQLQVKRFGADGDLFKQQKILVKPIQNAIWQAVQQVAKRGGYDFIFDKGSDLIMLYSNDKWDVSADVLQIVSHK
ncbi:MAG: OmpH family outer membrane protein [Flavobacteriales bacterium]